MNVIDYNRELPDDYDDGRGRSSQPVQPTAAASTTTSTTAQGIFQTDPAFLRVVSYINDARVKYPDVAALAAAAAALSARNQKTALLIALLQLDNLAHAAGTSHVVRSSWRRNNSNMSSIDATALFDVLDRFEVAAEPRVATAICERLHKLLEPQYALISPRHLSSPNDVYLRMVARAKKSVRFVLFVSARDLFALRV